MQRYILFVGDIYYPLGGALDIHSSYPSLKAAQAATKTLVIASQYSVNPAKPQYSVNPAKLSALVANHDAWWHIMDGRTGKIVCTNPPLRLRRASKPRKRSAKKTERDALDDRRAMIARMEKLVSLQKSSA